VRISILRPRRGGMSELRENGKADEEPSDGHQSVSRFAHYDCTDRTARARAYRESGFRWRSRCSNPVCATLSQLFFRDALL
jgi:hypothetical protein